MSFRWQEAQHLSKTLSTVNQHLQVNQLVLPYGYMLILADVLTNPANVAVAAQANVLGPLLNGLGSNLAALTGVSTNTNSMNIANTLIQQQLTNLLATSPVVLVSNLDEVSLLPLIWKERERNDL